MFERGRLFCRLLAFWLQLLSVLVVLVAAVVLDSPLWQGFHLGLQVVVLLLLLQPPNLSLEARPQQSRSAHGLATAASRAPGVPLTPPATV